jgi:hypothetical protein
MSDGLSVTSITVGLDLSDKTYGTGISRSVFVKAETPAGQEGIPLKEISLKILNLLHEAHCAIQGARFSQGDIGGPELEKILDRAEKRTQKVREAFEEMEQP